MASLYLSTGLSHQFNDLSMADSVYNIIEHAFDPHLSYSQHFLFTAHVQLMKFF